MTNIPIRDITEDLRDAHPDQFHDYPLKRILVPAGWYHPIVSVIQVTANMFPAVRYTQIEDKNGTLLINHHSKCGIAVRDMIESIHHICCDRISYSCVECGSGEGVEIDTGGDNHYAYCNLHAPKRKRHSGKIEKQLIYLHGRSRSSGY